ncbi:hypothetical protein Pla52n_68180 [Stieleria varia]|uniref:Uncharacterized protein n=1 Tax=Stieleria varia TaxID=2528005 RepID=A0A5C5ZPI9_9BACT|nr:hypothetical protein Pla52n_68180 [Stieleria varia]
MKIGKIGAWKGSQAGPAAPQDSNAEVLAGIGRTVGAD